MASVGIIAQRAGLVDLQFHGYFQDTTSGTDKRTFNSVPFGQPAADRSVIVAYMGAGSNNDSHTITIGGSSATHVIRARDASNFKCHIVERPSYSDDVYSGTIEVTPQISTNGMIIGVWSVRRTDVTLPSNSGAGDFGDTNSGDTIDADENGLILAAGGGFQATGTGNFYLDLENTDFDVYDATNNLAAWGGHEFPNTDQTGKSLTWTTEGNNWAWCAISWNPE